MSFPGKKLTRLLYGLLDIIFLGCCLSCGRELAVFYRENYQICPDCRTSITFLQGPGCEKCGITLISEQHVCTRCRQQEYYFSQNRSVCTYEGVMRELLHHYKFKARQNLAYLFAELIGEQYAKHYAGYCVVPVPSRSAATRKRGWDHVKRMTRILQKKYGIPILSCLRRIRGTPQKKLGKKARFQNIRGSIRCVRGWKTGYPERVVLLDDIFTTGATANECARVLMENGVKKVAVLTLAMDQ